jgi:hypothetical protein
MKGQATVQAFESGSTLVINVQSPLPRDLSTDLEESAGTDIMREAMACDEQDCK